MDNISCQGGGDTCEDVAGGLQQAFQSIEWKSKYKLICLVADAPAHGKRFHDESVSDDYPADETAAKWVEKLAQENYSFVALEFTKYTNVMYNEFQKIYEENKMGKAFYRYSIDSLNKEASKNISTEIAKAITGSLRDTVSRSKTSRKKKM